MNMIIPIFFAVIPAIYLVYYYYKQDSAKPEPKKLIIKVFILGILSTFVAGILETILFISGDFIENKILYNFIIAFFFVALSEELVKMLVVKFFAYNRTEFDEIMDGIVYTIVASLGFACFENIIYVINGGISIAIIRAFTAIPLHALASGTMGYYIGKAKFDKSNEKLLFIKGLILAILIHGYYDFVLFIIPDFGIIPALTIFPLLIGLFFNLKSKIKKAILEDKKEGRI